MKTRNSTKNISKISKTSIMRLGSIRVLHKLNILLLIVLISNDSLAALNDSDFTIGVFPRRPAAETIEAFSPLAKHLETKIQRKVKIQTARDFSSFWKNVLDKKYDLVHFNQYHYIKAHAEAGYNVIGINEEKGKSTIQSIIVTHEETGINSIEDLKGRSVIFGGNKLAMVSYIVPLYMLNEKGLSLDDIKPRFTKNPPNAWLSAYYKRVDAASMGGTIAKMTKNRHQIQANFLKEIARSEPITQLPWAIRETLDPDTKALVKKTLINLSKDTQGKKILKSMKLTNILPANEESFDRVREIVFSVTGEKYKN